MSGVIIWCHLSRRRKIQLGLVLVVILASGVAELVSLGAVLPFLTVLNAIYVLCSGSTVKMFIMRLLVSVAA